MCETDNAKKNVKAVENLSTCDCLYQGGDEDGSVCLSVSRLRLKVIGGFAFN